MSSSSVFVPTPAHAIPDIVASVQKCFASGKTKSEEFRKTQLYGLSKMISENQQLFITATANDLRKPLAETLLTEIGMIQSDIALAISNLHSWMKPQKQEVELVNYFDSCTVRSEPLGTVLIIGAWNYPIQLTLVPLVGAIAAGNAVIIKPSELSENTAMALANLIPRYLDQEAFQVVNGGVRETTELLKEKFDHIFYTGNGTVGKIVMAAASRHLTPVTLELGGKSPCIVDRHVDVDITARRIVWGRFLNSGQTCIAPDYILCPAHTQSFLLPSMKEALLEYYGQEPQKSDSLARIVNHRHFERLKSLLASTKGTIFIGGKCDEKDKYIEPTIVTNVSPDDPLMQEEIFGPILPILNVESIDEAIHFVNTRDKPLALYVFSRDNRVVDKVIQSTSSGGVCVNDTLMHLSVPTLPFGGVGPSGMGGYHGKHTFDVFSHKKSVMVRKQALEFVNKLRYPPYTEKKLSILSRVLFKQPPSPHSGFFSFFKFVLIAIVGISAVALISPYLKHQIMRFFDFSS